VNSIASREERWKNKQNKIVVVIVEVKKKEKDKLYD
jgi:hypothetical protein